MSLRHRLAPRLAAVTLALTLSGFAAIAQAEDRAITDPADLNGIPSVNGPSGTGSRVAEHRSTAPDTLPAPGVVGAPAGSSDTLGAGGRLDRIYREIYQPGNPASIYDAK